MRKSRWHLPYQPQWSSNARRATIKRAVRRTLDHGFRHAEQLARGVPPVERRPGCPTLCTAEKLVYSSQLEVICLFVHSKPGFHSLFVMYKPIQLSISLRNWRRGPQDLHGGPAPNFPLRGDLGGTASTCAWRRPLQNSDADFSNQILVGTRISLE